MKCYDVSRLPSMIELGYDGENNWRPNSFDCSALLKNHPSGVISLWLLPNGESQAFPVALTRDGNTVVWTPLSEEMTAATGAFQIVCTDGTDVGKSAVSLFRVGESIIPGAEHPAAVPSWATQTIERAESAADRAEEAADSIDVDHLEQIIAAAVEAYLIEHPVEAPVQSVNGKTGAVVLDAEDVGALPADTPIPAAVTEQTVAGWGFTKNTGTYSKPSGGIPKTDLAADVQTSLGKADTALQQHQSLSGYATEQWVENKGYLTQHQSLAAYRTSAAQDTIDAGKLGVSENAYRSASIPMGELDSTSTATVMTATVPGITELRDGVCMWLRNGVITSASGFTINVNNLGAKPCYSSLAAESRSTTIFNVNYALLMIYNSTRVEGGCWDIVYGVDTNTTYTLPKLGFGYAVCTTAAATAAKTASINSYALTTGGIVSIKFENDVPANATLNITSKGAKAIYHRGSAITAGVIKAGDTATFVYSTYYHLVSIDRWGTELADLEARLDALTVLDEEVF